MAAPDTLPTRAVVLLTPPFTRAGLAAWAAMDTTDLKVRRLVPCSTDLHTWWKNSPKHRRLGNALIPRAAAFQQEDVARRGLLRLVLDEARADAGAWYLDTLLVVVAGNVAPPPSLLRALAAAVPAGGSGGPAGVTAGGKLVAWRSRSLPTHLLRSGSSDAAVPVARSVAEVQLAVRQGASVAGAGEVTDLAGSTKDESVAHFARGVPGGVVVTPAWASDWALVVGAAPLEVRDSACPPDDARCALARRHEEMREWKRVTGCATVGAAFCLLLAWVVQG